MPSVKVKDSESFDMAMRRFKRACEKAGIMSKLRQIEYYEKPAAKRKRKHAAAMKRNFKRQFKDREVMFGTTTSAARERPQGRFNRED